MLRVCVQWSFAKTDMRHINTLDVRKAALVVIDMQEAFRTVIPDFEEHAMRIARVVRAARMLSLPVVVTEQYPRGLGHTATEILAVLPEDQRIIEKTAFSSCGASEFTDELKRRVSRQILVCGIEAHICVNQTVHDLLAEDYQVHLLKDCITSRANENRDIAFDKMERSGAVPSSTEMALFELLRDSKHEHFKAIQELVK